MVRIAGIITFVFLVLYAATCLGEIVKVTADRTKLFDGEQVKSAKIKGKRFMVYGSAKAWYLVQMTINKKKVFRWIPKADVKVDWGPTETARVAKVRNVNTLKLSNGDTVRFAGIVVVEDDTPLRRRILTWLKGKLEGKRVRLEYDKELRKQGVRDHAYVYVGSLFVNRALVKNGLARVPYSYRTGRGRYVDVFCYYDRWAKKQGKGLWAEAKPNEKEEEEEEELEPDVELELDDALSLGLTGAEEEEQEPERTLSDADKARWDCCLGAEIQVRTKRTKTKKELVSSEGIDDDYYQIPTETHYVWSKTLTITVRNGWGFPLQGLTVKYELFARTGWTSKPVALHSSGEIEGVDLKPGESRKLECAPVDFEAMRESGFIGARDGYIGEKYHGYRVTFVYRGVVVKVVAEPSTLADFKVPPED